MMQFKILSSSINDSIVMKNSGLVFMQEFMQLEKKMVSANVRESNHYFGDYKFNACFFIKTC